MIWTLGTNAENKKEKTMKTIFLLLSLLVGLLISVAAIINTDVVTVNYLLGQIDLPLFMLILGSAIAGAMFIGFLNIFSSINKHMKSQGDRDYKKVLDERVKVLESETIELQAELDKQQKEREQASEKAYTDLENENKRLEAELKMQQKEHDDTTL